jgi:hypothetical protein
LDAILSSMLAGTTLAFRGCICSACFPDGRLAHRAYLLGDFGRILELGFAASGTFCDPMPADEINGEAAKAFIESFDLLKD